VNTLDAAIANNRFGLGGSHAKASNGLSRADLLEQLAGDVELPVRLAGNPGSDEIMQTQYEVRVAGSREDKRKVRKQFRRLLREEITDRLLVGIESQTPLIERLVLFLANHFTVSSAKGIIAPAIGAYEREAIRPNVLGRFDDLLVATSQHIVMLIYLDNHVSVGPNSKAGLRRKRDLNENFAREILELHTLGVNGGYSQNDVTELALALTGWTHGARVGKKARQRGVKAQPGFVFKPALHEPGERTVLGKRYPAGDQSQGIAILRDLARHPSTARHIATKLLTHFIQDVPDPADVDRIAKVYIRTQGDLRAVISALVGLESAWNPQAKKIKTPYELVVSAYRAIDQQPRRRRFTVNTLRQMGHMPFAAPSPAGWPDTARHWMSPEALIRRIEWARAIAATVKQPGDPSGAARKILGPLVSEQTEQWVSRAPSAQDAIAMVLSSHEFQRR